MPSGTDRSQTKSVGKEGGLHLTGPLAMSKNMRKMLRMHAHLLVDAFGKLGVDFYAMQTYQGLINFNAATGSSNV